MTVKLDRSRSFGTCEGDCIARYYQDGQYFDAHENPISAEEAGKPSPNGSFASRVRQEVEKANKPTEDELNKATQFFDPSNAQRKSKPSPLHVEPKPETNGAALSETAEDRPEKEADTESPDDRRAVLDDMPTSELNNLVAAAGGEKFKGPQARKKAIRYLLKHTE